MINKLLVLILLLILSVSVSATEECQELIADGEGEIPFEISLLTPSYERIESAKVRIVRVSQYFQDGVRLLNTVNSIMEFTNSKGVATLHPKVHTYSGVEKYNGGCREYSGFNAMDSFLIIEKTGFYTFHLRLDKADIKTTFYGEEKVRGEFTIVLLPTSI